jgi:hypothetical protein
MGMGSSVMGAEGEGRRECCAMEVPDQSGGAFGDGDREVSLMSRKERRAGVVALSRYGGMQTE